MWKHKNTFTLNNMKKNYKDITLEDIEKVAKEMFQSKLTYTELYDRLLSGYAYHINSDPGDGKRSIKISTGVGGVRVFLRQCDLMGLPADTAAIAVYIETNKGRVYLKDLKIKRNDNDTTSEPL